MKVIGQIHEGRSGIYLLSKANISTVLKWEVRYIERYTRTAKYVYLGSFQYKSEALDLIEKTENQLLNSEDYIQNQDDWFLKMLQIMEDKNDDNGRTHRNG